MESRKQPIGFLVKQINNVFEKELNGRLRTIGVTSPSARCWTICSIPIRKR